MQYWVSRKGQRDKQSGRIYNLAERIDLMLDAAEDGTFSEHFNVTSFLSAVYLWLAYHILYNNGEQYMVPLPDPLPTLDFLTKPKG